MSKIVLTDEQKEVVKGIKNWYKNQDKQEIKLVGYAGTGKTFLVKHIIEELKIKRHEVVFAAYTGKASMVLQDRIGNYESITTHRLAYDVEIIAGKPIFTVKKKKDVNYLKLIVIDEASMLTKEIYDDLLTFGVPIIFIGDEGQLPPIGDKFNVLDEPDFRLTEIHRQARGNPIIELSMMAREGKRIDFGKYGKNAIVLDKRSMDQNMLEKLYLRSDQIICGYNNTRKAINKKTRELLKFESDLPVKGDKLICLKNNWETIVDIYPLVNGLSGEVVKIGDKVEKKKSIMRDAFYLDFRPDFLKKDGDKFKGLMVLEDDFKTGSTKLESFEHHIYDRFDYGYAITCHKSQGSQYKNLLVMNEVLNAKEHKKWLYTAITRAQENLILAV